MPQIIDRAQPALHFVPHDLKWNVFRAVRFLLPFWLRTKLSIAQIQTENVETLAQHYQDFQQGQSRILIAFRHPSTLDPFTMAHLVWKELPKVARQSGIQLKAPVHSHFLYDRGVALWAGNIVNWLFPKLGGSSIFRGKPDREGLKAARQLLTQSRVPLAIAPEGATNDHSELVAPLEPGVAQLAFWAQGDLIKANRPEWVHIIPVSLRYEYLQPPWSQLEDLLGQLESDLNLETSFEPTGQLADARADKLYGRLLRIGTKCLDQVEDFYTKSYGRRFEPIEGTETDPDNRKILMRLHRVLDQVLQVSEDFFSVKPQGSFNDRCRKLEQAAWDCIFIEGIEKLSPIERGFADWRSAEASLRLAHMRLAERLLGLTDDYILAKPSADRFAEVILILWRISAWLKGKSPHKPPKLGLKRARIVVCEPIAIQDYWAQYQCDRRSAKKTVLEVTQMLQGRFESVIQSET